MSKTLTEMTELCLNEYNPIDQIEKFEEEAIELLLEIKKYKTKRSSAWKVAGEYADVLFTLNQIKELLDRETDNMFSKMIDVELNYKLSRQELRLEIRQKRNNS